MKKPVRRRFARTADPITREQAAEEARLPQFNTSLKTPVGAVQRNRTGTTAKRLEEEVQLASEARAKKPRKTGSKPDRPKRRSSSLPTGKVVGKNSSPVLRK